MAETLRAAQKALTRSRLLQSAEHCFGSDGYAATTVDDIATEAGATRATFYLHFGTKAEIAKELWELRVDEPNEFMSAELRAVLTARPHDPTVLRRLWFPRVVQHWAEHGALARALWHARMVEPTLDAALETSRERTAAIITEALQGSSRFDESALRIRAVAAFDIQLQLFLDWTGGVVPQAQAQMIAALDDAWSGLLG